jgi:hypothetical protein
LTKEWFEWRYPEDGSARYESHVAKSRHTIENYIERYGEELGPVKFSETISKKNTVALVKAKHGDQAVQDWYTRTSESHRKFLDSLSVDERQIFVSSRAEKAVKTKKDRYGDKTKLECYIDKYGEEGPQKYGEYLQTVFKGIGASKEAEILIKSIIDENEWLYDYSLFYRDSLDKSKVEWFISDKTGICFYDLCVLEAKVILEYDGSRWHPTEEQAQLLQHELMEVGNISYLGKFEQDRRKLTKAFNAGFTVFTVRSDFTPAEKQVIIYKFLEKIRQNEIH